jgi:hypothetical protein
MSTDTGMPATSFRQESAPHVQPGEKPAPLMSSKPRGKGGGAAVGEGPIAQALQPLLTLLFGRELPVRFVFWDGSTAGPSNGPGVITVRSVDAVRRITWVPTWPGISKSKATRSRYFAPSAMHRRRICAAWE